MIISEEEWTDESDIQQFQLLEKEYYVERRIVVYLSALIQTPFTNPFNKYISWGMFYINVRMCHPSLQAEHSPSAGGRETECCEVSSVLMRNSTNGIKHWKMNSYVELPTVVSLCSMQPFRMFYYISPRGCSHSD